jgi:hypothetical protein
MSRGLRLREYSLALDARRAMAGHVLAEAAVTGRYTLNPAVAL